MICFDSHFSILILCVYTLTLKSVDTLTFQDEGFSASWDLEDKEYVANRYFRNIHKADVMLKAEPRHSPRRAQLKQLRNQLVDEFRERIRRRYNDQTVYDFKAKNRHFEPQKIGYKYDRVLNSGIERMFAVNTGESGDKFTHFAAGDSDADTLPGTKSLFHEVVRVKMVEADTGFFVASGTTLNASGFISESIPTFSIREIGAVDNDGGIDDETNARRADTFLFRSVFPTTDTVVHTFGQNFTTVVHAIYSKSV